MRVSELLRVCTWSNQHFDVRNGSIENDKSFWEYNLSHTDVLDMFGNRNVRKVFSDTTQEHDFLMNDYLNGWADEPENEELTTLSIVLEDEFQIGDRVMVNRNCEERDWWHVTGTVKRITDETILIELDEEIYDGHICNMKELILYKWKFDFLNEEEE